MTRVGEFVYDDDPGRIDRDVVWAFLSTHAYWARWRTRDEVTVQLDGAWRVVGVYTSSGAMVAFARAVSDGIALAYLADLFVLEEYRGAGIGRRLVGAMIDDGPGANFRWMLHTRDAHGLYKQFGFAPANETYLERPIRMHYRPEATEIGEYLITARSLSEYRAMFGLTDDDLHGRILDCPGGASSFAAEAAEIGADTTAVDPVYTWPAAELARHAIAETERGTEWATATANRYVWDFYGDLEGHQRMRRSAAHRFAADLHSNPSRYRPGALPTLEFDNGSFDLVLSSHLLFTYADRLDFDFHLAALTELCRISRGEVRVFPLVDLNGIRLDGLIDGLRTALSDKGIHSELRIVELEFQRGARSALVLSQR